MHKVNTNPDLCREHTFIWRWCRPLISTNIWRWGFWGRQQWSQPDPQPLPACTLLCRRLWSAAATASANRLWCHQHSRFVHTAMTPTSLHLHAQYVAKVCICVLRALAAFVPQVTKGPRAACIILAEQNMGCCVVQAVWPLEQVQALVNRPTPASRYGLDTCSRLHC